MKWIKKQLKRFWKWFVTVILGLTVVFAAGGEPVILASSFDHNGETILVEYCNEHPDYPLCGVSSSISGVNPEYEFTTGNKTKSEACDTPIFPGADIYWIKEQVEDVDHWRTVNDYGEPYATWNEMYGTTTTRDVVGTHEENNPRDEWHEVSEICVQPESVKLFKVKLDVPFNGYKGTQGEFEIEFNGSTLI